MAYFMQGDKVVCVHGGRNGKEGSPKNFVVVEGNIYTVCAVDQDGTVKLSELRHISTDTWWAASRFRLCAEDGTPLNEHPERDNV